MTWQSFRGRPERHPEGDYQELSPRPGFFRSTVRSSSSPTRSSTVRKLLPSIARSVCAVITSAESGRRRPRRWATRSASPGRITDAALARELDIDEFAGRLWLQSQHLRQSLQTDCQVSRRPSPLGEDHDQPSIMPKDPGSGWMRMITGGGGFGLTIEQPENNIMRGTYYALVAALSGAQTMALCC